MSSIDIVVPCYRYGRYLRQCVQSLLTQDVDELRILVIDDDSPDETPEVGTALAREDSRVTYRRHAVNCGHINTYNEGIAWTNADYMLLISADDYLLPGALKRAMDLMDAHPEVGLCIGKAMELFNDDRMQLDSILSDQCHIGSTRVMTGADFIRLFIAAKSINVVSTPTAVVKTSLLKQLGGYRNDLPHTGDFEMWLRLAAHASVGIINSAQAVYRRHGSNMSSAYYLEHHQGDLQHRKAAFDVFLQTCGTALPEAKLLYASLLKCLGEDALSHASQAFNSNRMDLSRRLCEFAVSVNPGVRNSFAWKSLECKKLLGFKISSALQPAVARVRAAMPKAAPKLPS